MSKLEGCLFDLDGVIVDTAKYHFLAWKKLANELNIDFTLKHNELLKGVSRMQSLEIILNIGRIKLEENEKIALAEKKNNVYLTYIQKMEADEIFPGVHSFIQDLRDHHVAIALGSASKNAMLILRQLQIESLFDAIIDGTKVEKAKPNPEVFLKGAHALRCLPSKCVVFEDAIAGVEAAKNGGMYCVGIGDPDVLDKADRVIPGFKNFSYNDLLKDLK